MGDITGTNREGLLTRAGNGWPRGLPVQLTPFVGRERERAEVARLVLANRLVTLVGAGGVGKTRLAVEVAAAVAADFCDGAGSTDLSAVTDPASLAAEHLDRWEIIDYASDDKPDVPSGTARELAETLAQVREPAVTVALSDLHGPAEARGAQVAGVQIHSVRLPSFVVTTEVVFGGPGEQLVMRHDPGLTPAPYVAGTLLAVRNVADVSGVRRGLDWLLFGEPAPDPGP